MQRNNQGRDWSDAALRSGTAGFVTNQELGRSRERFFPWALESYSSFKNCKMIHFCFVIPPNLSLWYSSLWQPKGTDKLSLSSLCCSYIFILQQILKPAHLWTVLLLAMWQELGAVEDTQVNGGQTTWQCNVLVSFSSIWIISRMYHFHYITDYFCSHLILWFSYLTIWGWCWVALMHHYSSFLVRYSSK